MACDILVTLAPCLFLLWFKMRASPSWNKD